ncbi:MAG: MerR family transcriptional regulator [Candidatus Omnitrophica bacterium]|nr:MerR family transcriptional regulator [Candidatus Omnitrophota bacterium]
MRWEDIEREFEIEIPADTPVFPVNIVCELLDMQYHLLHEIVKEGLIESEKRAKKAAAKKKKKSKKLFSRRDVKRLKYIQYLMEDRGVNLQGVKVIIELSD